MAEIPIKRHKSWIQPTNQPTNQPTTYVWLFMPLCIYDPPAATLTKLSKYIKILLTESNTSASYLNLLLPIEREGQLRTSLYDKRDDFNFHITNFPFLSSNIPSSPANGVFVSQIIRYARACSTYECFILRAARISSKLLGKGYGTFEIVPRKVLWSMWGSHQTLWSLPLPNVTWHSGTWPYTMTPSIDKILHQFANLLPNWTL